MDEKINYIHRRDFLKASAIMSAGFSMPFFMARQMSSAQALSATPDDRVLVIIELAGGNDGLNTVVPYGDDHYNRARPKLKVPRSQILTIDDYMGFHQNLTGLKRLFDDGKVALVNGVGYPNPNRSHFRSTEIWQTASDADRFESTGWIGRHHDLHPGDDPDPLSGIAMKSELSQLMQSEKGLGIAFQNPNAFRWQAGPQGDTEATFARINKADQRHPRDVSETIHFLRQVTSHIIKSSARVIAASKTVSSSHVSYPSNALAGHLRNVARLITGGLPTDVYHVAYGGFDTHAGQVGRHQNLLKGFGDAVEAFMRDLKDNGQAERVLILCFSEFGRRVAENASGGTDHGTAGPMFLIGEGVQPGVHGKYPSLGDLDKGDLKFTVDFRSIYDEVLTKWLRADAAKILGQSFPNVGLINSHA